MKKIYIVLAFLLLNGAPAFAAEKIINFDSYIEINADSTLTITETIKVRAEGKKIKRGIYRDFPTIYVDNFGITHTVGFDVVSVFRDYKPEPYHIKSMSNGKRVYMGKSDYYLPRGREYTYTLKYKTSWQIGYFDDHDELYWNVTGNGWVFPIKKASAQVLLPGETVADPEALLAFTGKQGQRGKDYISYVTDEGLAYFETTKELPYYSGLTIVVPFAKGLVTQPSTADRAIRWVAGFPFEMYLVIALFFYYIVVWHYVGRDPAKGVVFPLFKPANDLSPAACRYILKMGFDNEVFTSAILSIAVKGGLTINESSGDYVLTKKRELWHELTSGERAIMDELFSESSTIKLEQKNYKTLMEAKQKLNKELKKEINTVYFFANSEYTLPGALTMVYLFGSIFYDAFMDRSWFVDAGTFVAAMIIAIWFGKLLRRPTIVGRKVMDKLEGFKLYLSTAEKDRLNAIHAPEKTVELFEAFLPYAVALDVGNDWAEQFEAVFARATQAEGRAYRPGWYYGSSWNSHHPAESFSSMGSSINSAISSASTPPGSSSGGGGGGSSGGGGGGGGGGGW